MGGPSSVTRGWAFIISISNAWVIHQKYESGVLHANSKKVRDIQIALIHHQDGVLKETRDKFVIRHD